MLQLLFLHICIACKGKEDFFAVHSLGAQEKKRIHLLEKNQSALFITMRGNCAERWHWRSLIIAAQKMQRRSKQAAALRRR